MDGVVAKLVPKTSPAAPFFTGAPTTVFAAPRALEVHVVAATFSYCYARTCRAYGVRAVCASSLPNSKICLLIFWFSRKLGARAPEKT